MDTRLNKKLIDKKLLDPGKIAELESEAAKEKKTLEEYLLDSGIVSETDIAKAKGELYDLPFVDLLRSEISQDVLTLLPQSAAETYGMVVFEKKDTTVKVALTDPSEFRALEALEFWAKREGYALEKYITSISGYRDAMKNYTAFQKEVSEAVEQIEQKKGEELREKRKKRSNISETIRKAPVAKIVTLIVEEAVSAGASDIHIEPSETESRARFRVDGVLRTNLMLPGHLHSSLVARIKVLANLKIDETRVPQDGRIRLEVYGEEINLRVSTLPMMMNEKIVMRILPTTTKVITLEELGFWGNTLEVLTKIIARPTGVLLISGPTGSGKSTTLYSMLTALNTEKVNITTLEDPIEYATAGVNQVQINTDVGLTFASGLRAILRQDPNIVMVGEIRDRETAELAIHTALTGHFMLSTIHAKDALGVIPRLVDMHVEPFLIGAALNSITAQRLVRKLCQKCKAPTETPDYLKSEVESEIAAFPDPELVTQLIPAGGKPAFFRPTGCEECDNSGYKGRTVVVEAISMTDELQDILNSRVNIEVLEKERTRQKLLSMKQDVIVKALRGETSLEELLRVTREYGIMMNKQLETLKAKAEKALAKATTSAELDEVELSLFGRKTGALTAVLKSLKDLPEKERQELGAHANELKNELAKKISHMRTVLSAAEGDAEPFDMSEPFLPTPPQGSMHPITCVTEELEECFVQMGFRVLDGPELENDFYNFTALNIAPDHPSRDMQDTFYIKDMPGRLMRTHTSPMQVRAMRQYGAPLAAIVPGRCFRNEATDARHEHTFHQLEGFIVDRDISFAHLKGVLETAARWLFGEHTQVRLRPKYYPFVEPGVNGEVTCMLCAGAGCRICKQTGFLETFGAGLIHPNVFRAADLDPRRWTGFAFGLGLTRLAMLKYGITDVRLFASADPNFLKQF